MAINLKKESTVICTHERDLFAVTINSDLTEGRGIQYAMALCENESTAIRMGKGRDVQGCDARIVPCKAIFIKGHGWLAPMGCVYTPTAQDLEQEKILHKEKAKQLLLDKFQKGEEISQEEREQIVGWLKK